jgi:hypothetical protein
MTRKHYNDMAARFATLLAHNTITFKDREQGLRADAIWQCIDEYVEHAAGDNPAFHPVRFRDYIKTVTVVKITEMKYEENAA